MNFSDDDLTPLLIPPPSESLRYGQGVVVEWNPENFENKIDWRGVTLTNLPVLAGADALSFKAGDTVGLMGYAPSSGVGSWWILGRLVIPGSNRGNETIEWMSSEIGKAVSSGVFAARLHVDEAEPGNGVTVTSSLWSNPSSGSPRPKVDEVEVVNNTAVVWISGSFVNLVYNSSTSTGSVYMSFDVDGPTSVSPQSSHSVGIGRSTASSDVRPISRVGTTVLLEGLTNGSYNFTAKYILTGNLDQAEVHNPRIVVLGL